MRRRFKANGLCYSVKADGVAQFTGDPKRKEIYAKYNTVPAYISRKDFKPLRDLKPYIKVFGQKKYIKTSEVQDFENHHTTVYYE